MRLTPQNTIGEPNGTRLPRLLLLLLLLWAILVPFGRSHAQDAASESELKAAYLYNFILFSEWPKTAFEGESTPFIIHVYEDDAFTAKLKKDLKDKKAHGRSFQVETINSPADAKGSHVIYIPASENRRIPQLLESVKGKPVLTVGDSPQFLEQGGIINFLVHEKQLRFEINVAAAEKGDMSISSKLLRLAITVKN